MKKNINIDFKEDVPKISQKFQLEMLSEHSKNIFQEISEMIYKKIIKQSFNDDLFQLMCEATYCVYAYIKKQSVGFEISDFQAIIQKNLYFIFNGLKIMKPNGKSDGRFIFINPKIILFPKKFLLVFTQKLVHTISASKYATGLIRNYKIFRHKNMKFINDHCTGLNNYWDLNERQTEYIVVSSLSEYFDLDENEYRFKFPNDAKVRLFTKCFSYKDIFVYSSVINYIFKNQMIEAYLNPNMSFEDVIDADEFLFIRETFIDFYDAYHKYLGTMSGIDTDDEIHSDVKFECLSEKFIILIKRFLQQNSEVCIEELKEHIYRNRIYIGKEESSRNTRVIEAAFGDRESTTTQQATRLK